MSSWSPHRRGAACAPLALALALACSACACAPTILRSEAPRLEAPDRSLSCVDLLVAPLAPAPRQSTTSTRILYRMHDRCVRAVHVDFAKVVVTGAYADEARATLEPTPASGVALSGDLDAAADGSEAVWYSTPSLPANRPPSPLVALCVDAAHLEVGSDAAVPPDCFRRGGDGATFAHVPGARTLEDALDEQRPADPSATATVTARHWYGENTEDYEPILCSEGYRGSRRVGWCDAFGMWRRPPALAIGFGGSGHRTGSAASGTGDLDISLYVLGPLYLGAEGRFGTAAGESILAGGGLAGVALPRVGFLRARAEVMAGGASTSAPVPGASVEPRLRLDAWLSPTVTIDAWAGAGVLDRGEWSGGLAATLHTRAFDGPP